MKKLFGKFRYFANHRKTIAMKILINKLFSC
jgi:hypothetical protein